VYENVQGRVEMGGGGRAGCNLTAVSGLGLAQKAFQTASFANRPGQVTLGETATARTIVVSGDVPAPVGARLAEMSRVLNRPGTLKVYSGARRRKIACRCTLFEEGERRGGFGAFTLRLSCDFPYFEDFEPKSYAVTQSRKLVSTSFTLPCIFSNRSAENAVIVAGDERAEPVLELFNNLGNANYSNTSEKGITIFNDTTGQKLVFELLTVPNERITFDIPNRAIVSAARGDLLSFLSPDSFLSDFWLEPGVNRLRVKTENGEERLTLRCAFANRYAEATLA
jgi:hypothetical protein